MAIVTSNAHPPGLFAQGIANAIGSPSESEGAVRHALLQMMMYDERAFCRAAGTLLLTPDLPGSRQLVQFLLRQKLFVESLASADRYESAQAVAVVHSAAKIGPLLGDELEQALAAALHKAPAAANVLRIMRILELIAAVSASSRFLAFQHELMAYPDPKVRSKAALLAGRSVKNIASTGRLLRDEDARVQANALEALWSLDDAASRALLRSATKSNHSRVRANALVGLYAASDVGSVRGIFEMAEHPDARFRASGFWAMGETGDSRFVPFLAGQLTERSGSERLCILRALTRIRKQEKELAGAAAIEILISSASFEPDGSRRLVLALRGIGSSDLSCVPPIRFVIWEGAMPARDYAVLTTHNPPLLISGMVAPAVGSTDAAYARAIGEALLRCLDRKRPDDLWRIDRYALGDPAPASPAEANNPPPDNPPPEVQAKGHHGFFSSPEQLAKVVSSGVSLAKGPSLLEGIEKAAQAISHLSGARHLFVFFHPAFVDELVTEQRRVEQLTALLRDERIVLHGFAPSSSGDDRHFQELCRAVKGGNFEICPVNAILETLDRIFSQLLNRYEITYRLPVGDQPPNEGKLVLSSPQGCGQAPYVLTPSVAITP